MKITLPADVLSNLPAPDSEGLARVSVALRVSKDGKEADIVEINDVPVGSDEDYEKEMPTPDDIAASITSPS